jgi:hypothetical protein
MNSMADTTDLRPALDDLQDGFARVRAQLHVLRLALAGMHDERDIRALLCQLGNIEEELSQSEGLLRKRGASH